MAVYSKVAKNRVKSRNSIYPFGSSTSPVEEADISDITPILVFVTVAGTM